MADAAYTTWDYVDFGGRTVRMAEDGPGVDVPPSVTHVEVREFARSHFPDGPASAMATQKVWLAYEAEVSAERGALPPTTLFHKTKIAMPETAKAWDALVQDWQSHEMKWSWSESRCCLAHIDWASGIALTQVHREPATSWRDRRISTREPIHDAGRRRSRFQQIALIRVKDGYDPYANAYKDI